MVFFSSPYKCRFQLHNNFEIDINLLTLNVNIESNKGGLLKFNSVIFADI